MTVLSIKDAAKAKLETGADLEGVVNEYKSALETHSSYKPLTMEEKRANYNRDKQRKETALDRAVPFISDEFSTEFRLIQGLYLVGGVTGHGKSTTLRNILAGYVNSAPQRKAFVVTNEEPSQGIYDGVACLLLGKDFHAHQKLKNSPWDRGEIEAKALELMDYIDVEAGDSTYNMGVIEDVKAVLEHAEKTRAGLVMLDYWQTVTASREDESKETFRVLKELGTFMKEYGRKATVPVVVFAQLSSNDEGKDFKMRIENDKTIANHAFGCIEIVPNFETKETKFVIHKDRLGGANGKTIHTLWERGRYVFTEKDI